MPKILIHEYDRSKSGASVNYSNYAVLIAGFMGNDIKDPDYAPTVRADSHNVYEFNSVGDFEKTIGCVAPRMSRFFEVTGDDGVTDKVEKSFYHYGNQMAYELLKMGYSVVYKSLGNYKDYKSFKDVIDAITDEKSWEIFRDKASYDFRFITHGLLSSEAINPADEARKAEIKILKRDAEAALLKLKEIDKTVEDEFANAAATPAIVSEEELGESIPEDPEVNAGEGKEPEVNAGEGKEPEVNAGEGKEPDSTEPEEEITPNVEAEKTLRKNNKFRDIKAKYQTLASYSYFANAFNEETGVPAYIEQLEKALEDLTYKTLTRDHINKVNGYIADLAAYTDLEKESNKKLTGRGDCVALIELDETCYTTQSASSKSTEELIIEGVDELASAINASVNGTYCAVTVPSVVYKMTAHQNHDNNKKFPGAFHYLACFMNSLGLGFAEWYAAAGYSRGVSSYAVNYTTVRLGEIAINALEPRYKLEAGDPTFACNVIANFRGSYYLWGNRTAHPLGTYGDNDGGDLVARSFLNIRQLCSTIKKQLFTACRTFTFDPNSDALWINFVNSIRPTLDAMKADQGIRDYKIIKVYTPTKATLKAKIRIIPIEAVEDFDIEVSLEDSLGETVLTAN